LFTVKFLNRFSFIFLKEIRVEQSLRFDGNFFLWRIFQPDDVVKKIQNIVEPEPPRVFSNPFFPIFESFFTEFFPRLPLRTTLAKFRAIKVETLFGLGTNSRTR